MGRALPGQHYCKPHQGNHSHYDSHNCTVCILGEALDKAAYAIQQCVDNARLSPKTREALQRVADGSRAALKVVYAP